ncbi:MAG: hypothetical protein P8J50_11375 [Acidimicrobiales bacterium]|nr:hypothetical protein [Acidimicrobiales bacterium]
MSPRRHLQLGDVLETLAETVGDRVAVVAGERRLTCAALDERVTRPRPQPVGVGRDVLRCSGRGVICG